MNVAMLKVLLRQHEDVRPFPYPDTEGKITIGVGRNLTDVGLSNAEIDWLLGNDVDRTLADLDRGSLGFPWRTLSEARQLVLADMCFNLGLPRLLKFVDFLAAIKAGDYRLAASEMLDSKWAKQVKGRATYLASMMETGLMP